MNQKDKKIFEKIDVILWQDWDPIELNDSVDCHDEYSSYVSQIFALLKNGADNYKITEYLYNSEKQSMGLEGNYENCQKVAEKLREIIF